MRTVWYVLGIVCVAALLWVAMATYHHFGHWSGGMRVGHIALAAALAVAGGSCFRRGLLRK